MSTSEPSDQLLSSDVSVGDAPTWSSVLLSDHRQDQLHCLLCSLSMINSPIISIISLSFTILVRSIHHSLDSRSAIVMMIPFYNGQFGKQTSLISQEVEEIERRGSVNMRRFLDVCDLGNVVHWFL